MIKIINAIALALILAFSTGQISAQEEQSSRSSMSSTFYTISAFISQILVPSIEYTSEKLSKAKDGTYYFCSETIYPALQSGASATVEGLSKVKDGTYYFCSETIYPALQSGASATVEGLSKAKDGTYYFCSETIYPALQSGASATVEGLSKAKDGTYYFCSETIYPALQSGASATVEGLSKAKDGTYAFCADIPDTLNSNPGVVTVAVAGVSILSYYFINKMQQINNPNHLMIQMQQLNNRLALQQQPEVQQQPQGAVVVPIAKNLCAICMASTLNRVFNCGHAVSCAACAAQIVDCPTCRAHITSKTPIFIQGYHE